VKFSRAAATVVPPGDQAITYNTSTMTIHAFSLKGELKRLKNHRPNIRTYYLRTDPR